MDVDSWATVPPMAPPLRPNQIVAYNLRRARKLRGWTQEQAALQLQPLLGELWSKATFSAAERSVDGRRVRQFTADDLIAFGRAFKLPIAWFLLPPEGVGDASPPRVVLPGKRRSESPAALVESLFGSDAELNDRLARLLSQLDESELTTWTRTALAEQASIYFIRLVSETLGDATASARLFRELADKLDHAQEEVLKFVMDQSPGDTAEQALARRLGRAGSRKGET